MRTKLDQRTQVIIGAVFVCWCKRVIGVVIALFSGEQKEFDIKTTYSEDGLIEVRELYRTEDDSIAWREFYRTDQTKERVEEYGVDGILENTTFYRADETMQQKYFIEPNGSSARWHYLVDGVTVQRIEYYDSDGVLTQIEYLHRRRVATNRTLQS